jgi:hypothetical protein
MGRALRGATVAAAAALCLAGCGSTTATYTAKGTSPCLRKLGYRVASASDPIAGTAANGGVVARSPQGLTVTIAFGADAHDARRLARVYRRVAPKRLRPLIQPQRNVVLVWTTAPTFEQSQAVEKCIP